MGLYTDYLISAGMDIPEANIPEVPTNKVMEDKIARKQLRLEDAYKKKGVDNSIDQSDSFLARNSSWLNPLKDAANTFLPEDYEYDKYEYNEANKDFDLLSRDYGSNKTGFSGHFKDEYNKPSNEYLMGDADFRSRDDLVADGDSPVANTRIDRLDTLETHADLKTGSKFETVRDYAGVSTKSMYDIAQVSQQGAEQFKKSNPEYSMSYTGEKDFYGRELVDPGDAYTAYMLKGGFAVPNKDASAEEIAMYQEARNNKKGMFATLDGTRIADAQWRYNRIGGDEKHNTDIIDDTINFGKAAGEFVVGTGVGIADWAAELAGGDLGTEEEKRNYVKELFNDGEDNLKGNFFSEQRSQLETEDAYTRMKLHGVNATDIIDSAKSMATASTFGNVLGFVGTMAIGGPATAIGKAAATGAKLEKAYATAVAGGKTEASIVKKLVEIETKLKKAKVDPSLIPANASIETRLANIANLKKNQSVAGKAADFASKHIGEGAITIDMGNNIVAEATKNNNGEDLGLAHTLGIYAGVAAFNRLDYMLAKHITIDTAFKKEAKTMIEQMTAKDLVGVAATYHKAAAYLGLDVLKEAGTEGIQEGADATARTGGVTDKDGNYTSFLDAATSEDTQVSSFTGAMGGVAAGGTMALGGSLGSAGMERGKQYITDEVIGGIDPKAETAFSTALGDNVLEADVNTLKDLEFTKESAKTHAKEAIKNYANLTLNNYMMPRNEDGTEKDTADMTTEELEAAQANAEKYVTEVKTKGERFLDRIYAVYGIDDEAKDMQKEAQKLVIAGFIATANKEEGKGRLGADKTPIDYSDSKEAERVISVLKGIKGIDKDVLSKAIVDLRVKQADSVIAEAVSDSISKSQLSGKAPVLKLSADMYKKAQSILAKTIKGSYDIPEKQKAEVKARMKVLQEATSKDGAMQTVEAARSSIFINGFNFLGSAKKSMETHAEDIKAAIAESADTSNEGKMTKHSDTSTAAFNSLRNFISSRPDMQYTPSVSKVTADLQDGKQVPKEDVNKALYVLRAKINDTVMMKKFYTDQMKSFATDKVNKIPEYMQNTLTKVDEEITTSIEQLQAIRDGILADAKVKDVAGVDYSNPKESRLPKSIEEYLKWSQRGSVKADEGLSTSDIAAREAADRAMLKESHIDYSLYEGQTPTIEQPDNSIPADMQDQTPDMQINQTHTVNQPDNSQVLDPMIDPAISDEEIVYEDIELDVNGNPKGSKTKPTPTKQPSTDENLFSDLNIDEEFNGIDENINTTKGKTEEGNAAFKKYADAKSALEEIDSKLATAIDDILQNNKC